LGESCGVLPGFLAGGLVCASSISELRLRRTSSVLGGTK
jgi:hypothetical protein